MSITKLIRKDVHPIEFLCQARLIAVELELAARVGDPLPADTDYTESEDKEIQSQINDIQTFPPEVTKVIWIAFGGRNTARIFRALRTMCLKTQPKAFATYVQILSLFPDPRENPSFRVRLTDQNSHGIANIIGAAFASNMHWRSPSGPGYVCNLMIQLLLWNNPALGDDKRASMDFALRKSVQRKVRALKSRNISPYFSHKEQLLIQRLDGVFMAIDNYRDYIEDTRIYHWSQLEVCSNKDCEYRADFRCDRCMFAYYCTFSCQRTHWREHRMYCLQWPRPPLPYSGSPVLWATVGM